MKANNIHTTTKTAIDTVTLLERRCDQMARKNKGMEETEVRVSPDLELVRYPNDTLACLSRGWHVGNGTREIKATPNRVPEGVALV